MRVAEDLQKCRCPHSVNRTFSRMAERSACGKYPWVCFLTALSVSHQVTLACGRTIPQNNFTSTERIPKDSELCFFDVEEFREANNHLAFYERQRYEIAIPGIDARGQLPCRLKLMYEDAGEELLPFDSDKESDHQGEWYIHRQSDEYYYLYFNGSDPEYYNLDSNSTGPKSGRYHVIGRNGKHFNTECSTC